MKRNTLFILGLVVLFSLAFGQTTAAAPTTLEGAMWRTGGLLAEGIDTVSTSELEENLRNLRIAIEGTNDGTLEVVGVAITDVEAALGAEPFDQTALVEALETLAFEMRAAAGEGDASLQVELASLIDQTAALIEGEGYTPRLEVDVP
jgi:hypothetical protein